MVRRSYRTRPLPDKENEDDFRDPDRRRQARLLLQAVHLQKLQLLNCEPAAFCQGGAALSSIGYDPSSRNRRAAMAKGQMRKTKEVRKPKKEKPKTAAANSSTKGK